MRRHWEAIGDKLEHEVADYALRLSGKMDIPTAVQCFSKVDHEAHHQEILLHLNCHNCSKPVERVHLTTGQIIRLPDNTYKLCLSPACDLEPGQKGSAGFHKRLGDWMPFTAVSLLKVPTADLSEALSKATAGNYLFFRSKPDIVLPKYRLCIFVHGCFWHQHPGCHRATIPATDTARWLKKFEANRVYDLKVAEELRALAWEVFVIWECRTRPPQLLADLLERCFRELRNKKSPSNLGSSS